MYKILIIEDEKLIREALTTLLERNDYSVKAVDSVESAEQHELHSFHLILSDVRLPGLPGTEIIQRAAPVPVIIMTSYAAVESAVEAMRMGAIDYISKPFNHDEMLMVIGRVLRDRQSQKSCEALKKDLSSIYPVDQIIGNSEEMVPVFQRLEKVAPTDSTVLIIGESGTGKELIARALHAKSNRADDPFVTFSCTAASKDLMEAELFGISRSSVHREHCLIDEAEGGTLFLDEIGELPLSAQGRLLQLLQPGDLEPHRGGNIRILASTHQDLRKLVQEELFRSDLYFRLRVIEIILPPLRKRGDDITLLAIHLLKVSCNHLNIQPLKISKDSFEAIRRYRWPGNVRELANSMERAALLCDGEQITPELLSIDHSIGATPSEAELEEKLSLEEYFRNFVLQHQEQMTETELAKRLGISRKSLWMRRQRFGIPRRK
ncbi:MAG: sigma-54-dependent Fis family transcriptional regulator [Gammaproteobacteria bacterium]|jgi:DNA-binding NtrC family response regulator|nr:sigma-54-dependent Fis family transcriptional regulator [Gammaproteobacteria bacterium]MBT3489331.1 sigma-54-dependent Fis family transcriptional regulator [Gammaproteobacteria bacterium]MBT3718717.1 sigma-54-dependent Fis family transcriptional regulator [Gammaproteobacteria bacterium]MBT3844638.1 sigma-54-dependent Fis family transcriptional regulator [Gammaproteobacteria bacterium]MBT3893338.1 sigma-54-dependent Fis family transcriptional regulator [Gammaproteobacteria bacterium]